MILYSDYLRTLSIFVMGILFGALVNVVFAQTWQGPTATPPGDNVSAPLSTSGNAEIKEGQLTVNFGPTTDRVGLVVGSGGFGGILWLAPNGGPTTPAAGMVYFDQTTNRLRYHNGTAWIDL